MYRDTVTCGDVPNIRGRTADAQVKDWPEVVRVREDAVSSGCRLELPELSPPVGEPLGGLLLADVEEGLLAGLTRDGHLQPFQLSAHDRRLPD